MKSVDTIRHELNIALREKKERADALQVLEDLRYDVSICPDDYHRWERARDTYRESIDRVAFLEAELLRCGNR